MFQNEHPTYILRRLEGQNSKLRRLAKSLDEVDPADPKAMLDAMKEVVKGMTEVTMATGSLAQWVNQRVR